MLFRSDRGPCLDCEVSIRQMEEMLREKGAMATSGTSSKKAALDPAGRHEVFPAENQIDYTGFRVTPDWVPDVST